MMMSPCFFEVVIKNTYGRTYALVCGQATIAQFGLRRAMANLRLVQVRLPQPLFEGSEVVPGTSSPLLDGCGPLVAREVHMCLVDEAHAFGLEQGALHVGAAKSEA